MRCSPILSRNRKLYPCPGLIYPQPYNLFSTALLKGPSSSTNVSVPSGLELFYLVSTYTRATSRVIWNRLNSQDRQVFSNLSKSVESNYRRLTAGFAIASKSPNDLNPYHDSGLYPWEIIKDKLRHPPPFASDIYDILIQEAFGFRKSVVKPERLFHSELELAQGDSREKVTRFQDLSAEQKTFYREIHDRKMEFFNLRRKYFLSRKVPNNTYNDFYAEQERRLAIKDLAQRNRVISELWKKSQSPVSDFSSFRGVLFKERTLEVRVAIVMDYIFESGSVSNFTGSWRAWRRDILGDDHYLDRIVFPYIVDRTAEQPLVRQLPLLHGGVWEDLKKASSL